MPAKNIEDAYILSPMQQGILFHALYAPESAAYFERVTAVIRGELNVPAFEQAWQQVVDRHPILRTAFAWENLDQPLQIVGRRVKIPFQQLDWRELAPADQQERLKAFLKADQDQSFKLSRAPLTRIILIQLSEDRFQFIWNFHQLLLDGWSSPLLLQEVFAFYEAFRQGRTLHLPPPRPYRDYIAWLGQQNLTTAEAFWRQTLKGFTAPTPLEDSQILPDKPDEAEAYDEQQIKLSPAATAALQAFAQQNQLTLNTLVQGAWALLLSRYSGEDEVLFGVTVSGRPATLAGVEQMIGLFINTLPLRVRVPSNAVLHAWLKELQAQQAALSQYEYSPLVQIHGWSEVPRNLPLFETILIFKNYRVPSTLLQQSRQLQVEEVSSFERSNYPLTLSATPGQELFLQISYDCRRFAAATITRMVGHLQNLLEGMVANPEQPLSALPFLTEAEQHQLLVTWNKADEGDPQDHCIHQLFESQVEQNPTAVALSFEGESLTYQELNARSNQIAHGLRELADGLDRPVAILLETPPLQITALLAVLKAGGAFVCLDPTYPPARLRQILAEVNPAIFISESTLLNAWPGLLADLPASKRHLVVVDDHQAKPVEFDDNFYNSSWFEAYPATNLDLKLDPASLAYVVYTSGSTGAPKGIMQSHRSFCQFLTWQSSYFQMVAPKRIAQWASIIYDAAYCEIFGALCFGATLCITRPGTRYDPFKLITWLKEEQIALLQMVPSFAGQLLAVLETEYAHAKTPLPHLEQLLLAGEVLPADFAQSWLDRYAQTQLFNLYGPSETVLATYYAVEKIQPGQRDIPIGQAIDGRQILILNRENQLCPIGVKGEIYIRSQFLTMGYYQRPVETARVFIQNPLHQNYPDPVYRAGDLGRWEPDGNLVFCGRVDHQVKIRGMRVELAEIEAVLGRHELVQEGAVVAHADGGDNQRLVAYIVPRSADWNFDDAGEASSHLSSLQRFLKEHLPAHMCPAAFVFLAALPRTPTGKLDRKALPKPGEPRLAPERSYTPPQTELETFLAGVWQNLLHVESVGRHDNFFDLGGHSLLVTQVANKVRQFCGVELPLRTLFERPTLAELAESIEASRQAAQAEQAEIAQLIAQIKQMSDEEAQALLQQKRSVEPKSPEFMKEQES